VADIAFVGRVKGWQTGEIAILSSDYFITGATEHFWSTIAQPGSPLYYTSGLVCASLASLSGEMEVDSIKLSAEGSISLVIDHLATKTHPVPYSKSLEDTYIGADVTLEHYLQHWSKVNDKTTRTTTATTKPSEIKIKAYARVGLMGNPSDGFYGKTMSLLISNFWAEVTLFPQPSGTTIEIIHKPIMDPNQFANMNALTLGCEQDGYDNGDRLLLACCKVFYRYCHQMGIALATDLGFQILFDTNIPRQVGLAGSSAIITACWKSLMVFYGVTTAQIPPEIQANLVLSVEVDELGIAAGLQDRVIQTYGGLVYMDFDKTLMHQIGRGRYIQLDTDLLPPLYLAYVADPEDSGKVHSTVKQRFLNGDTEVRRRRKKGGRATGRFNTWCFLLLDHSSNETIW
jgi:glucuronokinase